MTIKTYAMIFVIVTLILIGFVAGCTRLIDLPTVGGRGSVPDQLSPQTSEDQNNSSQAMIVEGDDSFIEVTNDALSFIEQKSPEHYAMVNQYMKKIKQTEQDSCMLVQENPPTFIVNNVDAYSSLCWYASDIVHDAYHSKLYHDYLAAHSYVPDHIYSGYEAEMKCLQIQKEFLIAADAEQRYLDWIEVAPATRWWEN